MPLFGIDPNVQGRSPTRDAAKIDQDGKPNTLIVGG
jgi:hypothetical protein